ncbi:hypothetical protein P3342_004714 [Pyrenophora teres f. teres]|nr:hypothetical protein P3342_004714 [Pyrenophora teres f. teres]
MAEYSSQATQPEHAPPMDIAPEHVPADTQEPAQKHMDQTMDTVAAADDSMNTTITASTVGPPPDFSHNNSPNPRP